jgi:hypothetical protein
MHLSKNASKCKYNHCLPLQYDPESIHIQGKYFSGTSSLTKHGKEIVDIDHYDSEITTQTIGGSKCQAQKMSHNLGIEGVPRPHYQCTDNIQLHHHLAQE